jgi:hypothetical protein
MTMGTAADLNIRFRSYAGNTTVALLNLKEAGRQQSCRSQLRSRGPNFEPAMPQEKKGVASHAGPSLSRRHRAGSTRMYDAVRLTFAQTEEASAGSSTRRPPSKSDGPARAVHEV